MKLPEKPPQSGLEQIGKLGKEKLFAIAVPSTGLKEYLDEANADYHYWSRYKQGLPSDELSAEEAWMALKMYRRLFAKQLPFTDRNGNHFTYFVTPSMQSLMSTIDQYAAGHLRLDDTVDLQSAGNERFIISSLMEEAIASSQIEGAATTRAGAKQMLRDNKKPVDNDQRMIVNNYKTILKIRESWQREKLTPDLIHEMHKSIAADTLRAGHKEGVYRTRQDDDEKLAVYDESGIILHELPPYDRVPKMVADLCEFANKDHSRERFIHPVIKAIILHFWFAYIHPYPDGNGRAARSIFYWYMLSKRYWLFEYLPVSRVILHARQQYYRAFLHTEFDEGDLNYFLMNQLTSIDKAIETFKAYLERKRTEDLQSAALLRQNPNLNRRQTALLMHALRNPNYLYTLKGHQTACAIVYETARKDLTALVEAGFLTMHKEGKKFYFVAVRDFSDKIQTSRKKGSR